MHVCTMVARGGIITDSGEVPGMCVARCYDALSSRLSEMRLFLTSHTCTRKRSAARSGAPKLPLSSFCPVFLQLCGFADTAVMTSRAAREKRENHN